MVEGLYVLCTNHSLQKCKYLCRSGSRGSDWSSSSDLRDSCLSTDAHLQAAVSDLLPFPWRRWQTFVLPWQLNAAFLPLQMVKSWECKSLCETMMRTGSTSVRLSVLALLDISCHQLTRQEALKLWISLFVADATELPCPSHVPAFLDQFWNLKRCSSHYWPFYSCSAWLICLAAVYVSGFMLL